jgi:hypothetical protein
VDISVRVASLINFDSEKNTLSLNRTTTEVDVGIYRISITLLDVYGNKSTYDTLLEIISTAEETLVEIDDPETDVPIVIVEKETLEEPEELEEEPQIPLKTEISSFLFNTNY